MFFIFYYYFVFVLFFFFNFDSFIFRLISSFFVFKRNDGWEIRATSATHNQTRARGPLCPKTIDHRAPLELSLVLVDMSSPEIATKRNVHHFSNENKTKTITFSDSVGRTLKKKNESNFLFHGSLILFFEILVKCRLDFSTIVLMKTEEEKKLTFFKVRLAAKQPKVFPIFIFYLKIRKARDSRAYFFFFFFFVGGWSRTGRDERDVFFF